MTQSPDELEADADRLYDEGKIDQALEIYRQLVRRGSASGYYGLAQHARMLDDWPQIAVLLSRIEALCAENDPDACFYGYRAYRMGWGQLGFEQNNAMGSKYLLRAAELGDTYSQYALALEHFGGSNGQAKDEALYLHWIEKAIEGGSEDAVYEHVKFLLDKRRPVPPALIADLEILAKDHPAAAKLLSRVKRKGVKWRGRRA